MATQKRFQAKNGLDNNSKTITNVANPVNANDAATKEFSSNASNLTSGMIADTRIPNLNWYKITTGKPTTLAGYGITDALQNVAATGLDVNAFPSSSLYKLTGAGWANIPSGAGGNGDHVLNAHWDVNASTQLYLPYNNNTALAWRRKSGGSYSGWMKLYHEGNKPTAADVGAMSDGGSYGTVTFSNWVRTSGDTGWYSETYGGGMHMTDTTWVRVYNGKNFYTAGEGAFGSNVTAYYSDERLKEVIEELDPEFCLDAVNRWRKVRYHANDLGAKYGYDPRKLEVGLLAGEVNKDFPELTPLAPFDYETLEDGSIVSKSGENYKTMTYERVVAVQAAAITALTRRLEKLEGKLNV